MTENMFVLLSTVQAIWESHERIKFISNEKTSETANNLKMYAYEYRTKTII
jgi:hypothetical protein